MNSKLIIFLVLIVLIIVITWYITNYNKFKKYSIKVNESLAGIDVALTKRYDVLTKMIEVVKGYAKHEKEVLFDVVKLRKNMAIEELNKVNKSMNSNFEKIDLTVENYPDLKANDNFKLLQKSILDVEEHLQAARRIYNSRVLQYNQMVESFPSMIVAKMLNYKTKDFFEAEEKNNVEINL